MNKHFTNDQREVVIRQPAESDAERIISYSKVLFASTDQVLNTSEEYTITIEDEKKWISGFANNADALLRIAEMNNEVVGMLFFIPNQKKKNSHTGEFGVNVHPNSQHLGIGQMLVETLLNWARLNPRIEKVYLQVFASNANAIRLYNRLGFIEEGRHIKAIKQASGEYVDVIQMYIETT